MGVVGGGAGYYVPYPRGSQERPLFFPCQGQGSIPPSFQPERPLHAQNRGRKARMHRGFLCISHPTPAPPMGAEAPSVQFLLYQVCFLQFCPLGRHDGGGQSVLNLPTSPRRARDQATGLCSPQVKVRAGWSPMCAEQLRSQCPGPNASPECHCGSEPGVPWPLRRGTWSGSKATGESLLQRPP